MLDGQLNSVRILPFSIQLLVENALKHGIDKQIAGGLLEISAKREKDKVIIQVKNPGELKIENSKGLGLKNLTDRLQLKYKGEAQFEINEVPHNAVLATLIIPISE